MCEVLGPCGVLLPMGTVHSNNDEYEYIRISWLIVFLHVYSLLDIIKDLEIIYSIH